MGLEKTQFNLSFLSETVRNEAIKVLNTVNKEPSKESVQISVQKEDSDDGNMKTIQSVT